MPPIITIGIPVYNAEQYIEKAILSALNQSFSLPYEILVVDDGGTDDSMCIVRRLITQNSNGERIRIVEHNQNLGLGCARTTIIGNSYGKYLFFLGFR